MAIGFIALGLHGMEIEDHYGDLQEFYYKSKNGDLMIFGEFEKIGLVDKTWKRIRVVDSKKDTVDLYTWFYDDRFPNGSNILYRAKEKFTLDKLNKEVIRQKIEENKLKKVISITKTNMN